MLADPMIAAPNLVCCILMAEQPTNTWVKWEVGVPSDALSSYKDQFWELIYWGGVDPSCTYQEPRGGIDVTILKTEQ